MSLHIAPLTAAPQEKCVSIDPNEDPARSEWEAVNCNQNPVRGPAGLSQTDVNVVAGKYSPGKLGSGSSKNDEVRAVVPSPVALAARQGRRKMPNERNAITRKFSIGGHQGYVIVGLYEDGTPGEVFITMAKEGSTISGMIDAFAIAISHCLQYGVPLQALVDKYKNVRFEPSGFTGDQDIPYAKSIVDFIFQWLEKKFPKADGPPPLWIEHLVEEVTAAEAPLEIAKSDAPVCSECGSLMVPNGSCHKCENCGGTSGCS